MSLLTVRGLVKTYSRRRVVDGVDMEIDSGEIVGLLGPNGAGKSTCFKIICGLVRPDKGEVFLEDNSVTYLPLHVRSRLGMGYLPQQTSLFSKLSVQANLLGMMQLLSFSKKDQKARCEELLEQFNIAHVRKSKAETLSGGERRRLEIARCLISNPKIIMLDEPFAAIDPVTVQNIQEVIRQLANNGIAILITDHAAREILDITHRTYVVSDGRILCSGSAEQILTNEQVRRKYLGDLQMTDLKPPVSKREHDTEIESENFASIPLLDVGDVLESEDWEDNFERTDEQQSKPNRPRIIYSDRPIKRPIRTDLD